MRDDYNNPNFNAYANQGFKGANLTSSGGDYLINQAQNPTYELHISRIPPGKCVQNFRMVLNSDPLISITSLVYLKIKGSLWCIQCAGLDLASRHYILNFCLVILLPF